MRSPEPEFAGSAVELGCVPDALASGVPPFACGVETAPPVLAMALFDTFGAVAAACAARTATPTSEAAVITRTEYVAPWPGFFGAAREPVCGRAAPDADDPADGPAPRDPMPRLPIAASNLAGVPADEIR